MSGAQEQVVNTARECVYGEMQYGNAVEHARRKAGLSQAKLGAALGKTQATVSAWEKNQFKPGPDDLVAISDLTGVSLDELMRGMAVESPAALSPAEDAMLELVRALGLDPRALIPEIVKIANRKPVDLSTPVRTSDRDGSQGGRQTG